MEKVVLICIVYSVVLFLIDCFKVYIIFDIVDVYMVIMYMFYYFKKMIVIVIEIIGIYCVIYVCMCNFFFFLIGKDGCV